MFVRLKNGLLYGVFSNGIDNFAFTHDAEKADSDFERVRDKYRKKIDLDSAEIGECFEAVFKVRIRLFCTMNLTERQSACLY
ncbi:MAG: hypothetical protein K6E71_00130 [Lachnospiraceae bacterium]|nr:hypothetical protein [Lachnospiraceae bacterium]